MVPTTTRRRARPVRQGQQPRPRHGGHTGEAAESRYDVVVVGAGIGGLTAGALLARAGRKVLVVDGEREPGGYARALVRGPYTFDRADHLVWGCEESGPYGPGVVDAVLRHLGVRGRCDLRRVDDPVYQARFPGLAVSVPAGREAFLDAHLRHFPSDSGALYRVVEAAAEVYREALRFPLRPGFTDLALSPRRFPALLRHQSRTLAEVLDREIADPRLRAVYSALWSWVGQPPSRASFLMWSILLTGYVEDGAYVCAGGFQSLADAFGLGLTRAGGELLLGTPVTRVRVGHGRVQGVELAGGQRVDAAQVVANVDARDLFGRLVAADDVPGRYLHHVHGADVSISVFVVYAATDLDVRALGAQRDVIVSTFWDHERTYRAALAGEVTNLSVLIPTLTDPSLAPPGEHLVILQAVAADQAGLGPHDDAYRVDRMLELAEQVLPGLRQHLTHLEPVGPDSGSALHHLGPIYGWAGSPQTTGLGRLDQHTPIGGLLLAGQWTRPGPGIATVVQSGIGAARLALGVTTDAPPLPLRL